MVFIEAGLQGPVGVTGIDLKDKSYNIENRSAARIEITTTTTGLRP
jgi:hypothetical protein